MALLNPVNVAIARVGIAALLRSEPVQRHLDELAARVAQAAASQGIRISGDPGVEPVPIEVVSAGDSTRARAIVAINSAAGLAIEAKHRLLGSSLDAAH